MVYGGRVYKMTPRRTPRNERDLLIGWMKVGGRRAWNVPSRVKFEIILVLRMLPKYQPKRGGDLG
jgi:hypothetical protein